ncbi:MAG: hypothetical protein A3G18_09335 [Rhodospirillales bacterium RIFCSPLOWO2_12_FULL_58_28]|nr:MAG: hypothetical protein A3H92_02335 [Rhodospirillales bacterium RIFCSPLOWO2_02_FULL_58_16]OHC76707.1 MAG: hypothetical protein A3G18_09335 [Rhodospirillales bacterium RIFCSPLOWO2_12_FULL_58_28]
MFFEKVLNCIRESDLNGPLSCKGGDVLDGLSGSKTVGVLQRLTGLFADDPTACYVEIGVFQGLTLFSVAVHFPDFPCFGIDNFSILDPQGKNYDIVTNRKARLNATNATLINKDFEVALETLGEHLAGRKVGVYFIDGAHDYRSQLIALLLAAPLLHENAVILVDDANYAFVRQSTRDFLISHPKYKMIFEAYSPDHPANMAPNALKQWEKGWLNGINILVRDPAGALPEMLPPTEADRTLYVNDWLVHRHQLAELAPQALNLAQAVCRGDGAAEAACREELINRFNKMRDGLDLRRPDRNTYSAGLTTGRYNEL